MGDVAGGQAQGLDLGEFAVGRLGGDEGAQGGEGGVDAVGAVSLAGVGRVALAGFTVKPGALLVCPFAQSVPRVMERLVPAARAVTGAVLIVRQHADLGVQEPRRGGMAQHGKGHGCHSFSDPVCTVSHSHSVGFSLCALGAAVALCGAVTVCGFPTALGDALSASGIMVRPFCHYCPAELALKFRCQLHKGNNGQRAILDIRNTVGNIPMEWYQDFPHIGYDLDGRKIFKPLRSKDQLEQFLDKMENPDYW
uniref:BOP1 N-terminal domain-containing protein n=1 Tax=Xenopus tropicalis TaxID=8364 RepID=A0A1B8Y0W5_XENTR